MTAMRKEKKIETNLQGDGVQHSSTPMHAPPIDALIERWRSVRGNQKHLARTSRFIGTRIDFRIELCIAISSSILMQSHFAVTLSRGWNGRKGRRRWAGQLRLKVFKKQ